MITVDGILILWDIDGTLNVHGKTNHWPGEWATNTVTRHESPALFEHFPQKFDLIKLRVSQGLMDNFSSLFLPNISHQWFTAWEQEAPTLFAPKMGFEAGTTWPVVLPVSEETGVWWKTEAVRAMLSKNPALKVIWVDDLIDTTEHIEDDNRRLNEDFPGQLAMVGVMPHQGVTPDVFAFIRNLTTGKWQDGMFIFE